MTARFGFPKSHRLRSPAEFDAVYNHKLSRADGTLVIYFKPNGLPHARLGLSVSRKCGPAVVRNRLKRLYREAFRRLGPELPPYDLVLIPRRRPEPTLHEVLQSLGTLTARMR
jgi:ribonuclease P protein component